MSPDIKYEEPILLKNQSETGDLLEAAFLPSRGMNMISFKKGNIEVIDQSTRGLFEERSAGLGALIGPHFHHRNPSILPKIQDESLFPHIARLKEKGIQEPFSHGIARYAPWSAHATDNTITAKIKSTDVWKGVTLASLEGQNFSMEFQGELLPDGLHLNLSVVSDTDSLVGIHYYYHLPNRRGKIISQIQKKYKENNEYKPIPSTWTMDDQQVLFYEIQEADFTFHPFPNPLTGTILLDAETYRLKTKYECASEENSWQLYHPANASFVCIEPISSQDPRHPNLTVSSLKIHLQIE
jgi:hypothetical protein